MHNVTMAVPTCFVSMPPCQSLQNSSIHPYLPAAKMAAQSSSGGSQLIMRVSPVAKDDSHSSTMGATNVPPSLFRTAKEATNSVMIKIISFLRFMKDFEEQTRPGTLGGAGEKMKLRYESLPEGVKTPGQMLGRLTPGCEGTHGVFPKCNFACSPCYHGRDANRVPIDGLHTVVEVARQMKTLVEQRGPVGHCQLIGGEVSLLSAQDHAKALQVMRFYGRIPMSFTHGDFDYQYLKRLCIEKVDDAGFSKQRRRFDRVDFAVHFDRFMVGRKGVKNPKSERELLPYRNKFVRMFKRLRKEHGVKFYLAHNMTVQPGNLEEVSQVVRDSKNLGWRMMSFQPAAYQGDERRWKAGYAEIAKDDGKAVWKQIEKGAGCRLPYTLFQMGDLRCNRTCIGALVGAEDDPDCPFIPFFDDRCKADERVRDAVIKHVGNIVLSHTRLSVKIIRVLVTQPWLFLLAFAWFLRFVNRAGGIWKLVRYRMRIMTFVMHRFMDAEDVTKAWDLMEDGVAPDDPRVEQAGPKVKETMERLSACSYGMAQVNQRRLVPACVQHSIYDAHENALLVKRLKLGEPSSSAVAINMAVENLLARSVPSSSVLKRPQHNGPRHP